MEHSLPMRRPALREVGLTLLLYATIVTVSLALEARRPATPATLSASCAAIAVGTLTMAFVLRRRTPYPRRAFLGAAAVLAASAMVGPWLFGQPEAWSDNTRSLLWMHPWYVMTMAWAPTGRGTGICSPSSRWAGWVLIGTAGFLGVISWAAVWLSRRV